ncbi:MAG: glycosyltransferase [Acidobacteria bacterium]|nr:glycosyltransferase [Acidobacteriota bacterium]
MHILFVDTTNDSERIGGGHLYLPGLLNRLVERKHDVHLVTKGEPNGALRDKIYDSGASVHTCSWIRFGIVNDNSLLFAKLINDLSPDIYLISGSCDIGWVSLPLLEPTIATLMTAHNDSETFYHPLEHYAQFLTRAIGVSEEICREFVDRCGIAQDRIDWIPYGVRTSDAVPWMPVGRH